MISNIIYYTCTTILYILYYNLGPPSYMRSIFEISLCDAYLYFSERSKWLKKTTCMIYGLNINVADDSGLQGCDAVSLSEPFLTFTGTQCLYFPGSCSLRPEQITGHSNTFQQL